MLCFMTELWLNIEGMGRNSWINQFIDNHDNNAFSGLKNIIFCSQSYWGMIFQAIDNFLSPSPMVDTSFSS